MSSNCCPTAYYWTSMSVSGGSSRVLLDLNVRIWRSQPHIIGPQCPYLAVRTAYYWTSMSISGGPTAYYWTSMSTLICRKSLRGATARRRRRGGDGDDVPTTLASGRSPGPSCQGSKYPIPKIPHFDSGLGASHLNLSHQNSRIDTEFLQL